MPWFPPFANFLLRPQSAVGNVKAQSGVGWEVLCGSKDRRMEASEISDFDEQLLCAMPWPGAPHAAVSHWTFTITPRDRYYSQFANEKTQDQRG